MNGSILNLLGKQLSCSGGATAYRKRDLGFSSAAWEGFDVCPNAYRCLYINFSRPKQCVTWYKAQGGRIYNRQAWWQKHSFQASCQCEQWELSSRDISSFLILKQKPSVAYVDWYFTFFFLDHHHQIITVSIWQINRNCILLYIAHVNSSKVSFING